MKKKYKKFATMEEYTPWIKNYPGFRKGKVGEIPPCTFGEPIIDFLNKQYVKQALHVPVVAPAWDLCRSEGGSFKYTK